MVESLYPIPLFLNKRSPSPLCSTGLLSDHDNSYSSKYAADYDSESGSLNEGSDDDLLLISALLSACNRRQRPNRGKAFPRIVKQDIRRHYGQMLFNVFNSHDGKSIDAFLDRYALPSIALTKQVNTEKCVICRSYQRNLQELGASPGPVDIVISGKQKVSQYMQALQSLSPDQIMRINGVNISRNMRTVTDPNTGKHRLVSGDETKVVCDWEGRATQIYDVSPPFFAYISIGGTLGDKSTDGASCFSSSVSLSSNEGSIPPAKRQRLDESVYCFTQSDLDMFSLKRRPAAFEVSLRGRLVMVLDREFRLKSIDFGSVEVTY